jgi:hypothetical protein
MAEKQSAVIKTKYKIIKSSNPLSNSLKGEKAKTCEKKICWICGKEFKPAGNNQKRCSEECSKKVKFVSNKVLVEPVEKIRNFVTEKPYQPQKPIILTEPETGKKTRILKIGEHICANKKCKMTFKSREFNQHYCSIKCEAEAKDNKFGT